jgi:hypothetical protein
MHAAASQTVAIAGHADVGGRIAVVTAHLDLRETELCDARESTLKVLCHFLRDGIQLKPDG